MNETVNITCPECGRSGNVPELTFAVVCSCGAVLRIEDIEDAGS